VPFAVIIIFRLELCGNNFFFYMAKSEGFTIINLILLISRKILFEGKAIAFVVVLVAN